MSAQQVLHSMIHPLSADGIDGRPGHHPDSVFACARARVAIASLRIRREEAVHSSVVRRHCTTTTSRTKCATLGHTKDTLAGA